MNKIVLWFVKLTGWIPHLFYFKKKIIYVNKKCQSRKIKGSALIISNHKSIYDVALYMYVFLQRDIHMLVGEVMYKKNKLFSWFLNKIGGIKVDRDSYNFNFLNTSVNLLNKGKVLEIYPESRLPKKDEIEMLPFKPSFIYIALESGAPIIPVYTDGNYNKKCGCKVVIGEKINLRDLYNESLSENENIDLLCKYVENYIKELEKYTHEEKQQKK